MDETDEPHHPNATLITRVNPAGGARTSSARGRGLYCALVGSGTRPGQRREVFPDRWEYRAHVSQGERQEDGRAAGLREG